MKNSIVFLVIFCIIISCKNRDNLAQQNTDGVTEIIFNDILEPSGLLFSELFDSIRFIKLETTTESIIGRIDKLIYYKSRYYIMDQVQSKSVLIFDDKGKYLGKVGSHGNGPGEYDEPNDIAIDPFSDKILVYDNNRKSILSFDTDGKFNERFQLNYWVKSFSVLDSNLISLYFDYNGNNNIPKRSKYNLFLIDRSGNIKGKEFKYDKNISFGLGGFNFFDRNNEELLVSPGYSNTIFSINAESVEPKYFIDFGKYTIPKDLLYMQSQRDFNEELKNSDYAFLNSYFETQDYLIFSFSKKGKAYRCFYSKVTGQLKYCDILLNNMYGCVGAGVFVGHNNGEVISYFDPSSIDDIKRIYNVSLTDGDKFKNELIERYETMMAKVNEKVKVDLGNMTNLIGTTEFNPTIDEIQFVNSIEPTDNPILIIAVIKDF